MAFNSTRLIEQIKVKGCLPEGRFTDQEILDCAYECLLSDIMPLLYSVREEFYVKKKTLAVTMNQEEYAIPSRAVGGAVREIKMVKGSGIQDLGRVDLEDINTSQTGEPIAIFLLGNNFGLFPIPSATSGTLWIYYAIRPSRLVPVSECARITAIDTTTDTVTVTIPTGWTTADNFDLVKGTPHFDILALDLVAASVAGGLIQFSAALPTTLVVGDYVTLAEETCWPFLPPEAHVLLAQAAAAAALESIGHPSAVAVAAKAQMLKDTITKLINPRIQGAPKALGQRADR